MHHVNCTFSEPGCWDAGPHACDRVSLPKREWGLTSRQDTRNLSSDTGFLNLGTVTCGARCFSVVGATLGTAGHLAAAPTLAPWALPTRCHVIPSTCPSRYDNQRRPQTLPSVPWRIKLPPSGTTALEGMCFLLRGIFRQTEDSPMG